MINPKLFLKDQQTPIVLPVQPVSGIGALCGVAVIITGVILTVLTKSPAPAVSGILIGLYLLFSLKVADPNVGFSQLCLQ